MKFKNFIRLSIFISFALLSSLTFKTAFAKPCEEAADSTCNGYATGCGQPGCGDGEYCSSSNRISGVYICQCITDYATCPVTCDASRVYKMGAEGGCTDSGACCEPSYGRGGYGCNNPPSDKEKCTGVITCDMAHFGECGKNGGCASDSKKCNGVDCSEDCVCSGSCDYGWTCGLGKVEVENGFCSGNYICCKDKPVTCTGECKSGALPCSTASGDGDCPVGQRCCSTDKDKGKFTDLWYTGPKITSLMSVITPVAKILYFGGLFIGMCFIVYAGYVLMTSEGNPQRTQEGQEQLTAAILGITFILLSSAILRVIITSVLGY